MALPDLILSPPSYQGGGFGLVCSYALDFVAYGKNILPLNGMYQGTPQAAASIYVDNSLSGYPLYYTLDSIPGVVPAYVTGAIDVRGVYEVCFTCPGAVNINITVSTVVADYSFISSGLSPAAAAGIAGGGAGGGDMIPFTVYNESGQLIIQLLEGTIDFRMPSAASGGINRRAVDGSESLVIPDGATLGAPGAGNRRYIVYALDNGGAVCVGVVHESGADSFKEASLVNAVGIGVSSDSSAVLYSSVDLAFKPCRRIGAFDINVTGAGVWSVNPSGVYTVSPYNAVAFLGTVTATSNTTCNDNTSNAVSSSWVQRLFGLVGLSTATPVATLASDAGFVDADSSPASTGWVQGLLSALFTTMGFSTAKPLRTAANDATVASNDTSPVSSGWCKLLAAKYLPLVGGTMTGVLTVNNNINSNATVSAAGVSAGGSGVSSTGAIVANNNALRANGWGGNVGQGVVYFGNGNSYAYFSGSNFQFNIDGIGAAVITKAGTVAMTSDLSPYATVASLAGYKPLGSVGDALGSTVIAKKTGGASFNTDVSGALLEVCNCAGTGNSVTLSGTWRCRGYVPTGTAGPWEKIA